MNIITLVINKIKRLVLKNESTKMFFYGFFVSVLGTPILFSFFIFSILNWEKINNYLIKISVNGDGQIFSTIAASILSVLAITFSLAVFSIQYAADKGTTKILSKFSNDPIYKKTFVSLSIFAFILFLISILPYRKFFICFEYILAFSFLTVTLFLLFKVFRHTTELVDPMKSIYKIFLEYKKYFTDTTANIKTLFSKGIFDDALKQVRNNYGLKMDDEEFLTTTVFYHTPELLVQPRTLIFDIFTSIKEFLSRKKHDVTDYGFLLIANCVGIYMNARKKSTDYSGIFGSSSDKFLVDIYEKLKDLNLMTIQNRDAEGAKQNMLCFKAICLFSLNFESLHRDNNNATFDLAMGYMSRNIIDAINTDLIDIGLDGAREIGNVGLQVKREYNLSILTITNSLTELAMASITKKDGLIIVDACSNSISQVFSQKMVFTNEEKNKIYYERTTASLIYDSVKKITLWYLELGFDPSINCFGLSGFYNVTNTNSFPFFVINYLHQIKDTEDYDKEVIVDLFHLYMDIGEKSGEKNTFLIHFLTQGIKTIAENILILDFNDKKEKYKEALDDVIWLISVYWRIYKKQPSSRSMRNDITMMGIDDLCYLGMRALNENDNDKFSQNIVSQICDIANIDIDKRPGEYDAPRSILKIIPIGILAEKKDKTELSKLVIEKLKSFQSAFLESNFKRGIADNPTWEEKYKESLRREMWHIYTEARRYRGSMSFGSNHYLQNLLEQEIITITDIKAYLNKIEVEVYGGDNITDDIIESSSSF